MKIITFKDLTGAMQFVIANPPKGNGQKYNRLINLIN